MAKMNLIREENLTAFFIVLYIPATFSIFMQSIFNIMKPFNYFYIQIEVNYIFKKKSNVYLNKIFMHLCKYIYKQAYKSSSDLISLLFI